MAGVQARQRPVRHKAGRHAKLWCSRESAAAVLLVVFVFPLVHVAAPKPAATCRQKVVTASKSRWCGGGARKPHARAADLRDRTYTRKVPWRRLWSAVARTTHLTIMLTCISRGRAFRRRTSPLRTCRRPPTCGWWRPGMRGSTCGVWHARRGVLLHLACVGAGAGNTPTPQWEWWTGGLSLHVFAEAMLLSLFPEPVVHGSIVLPAAAEGTGGNEGVVQWGSSVTLLVTEIARAKHARSVNTVPRWCSC